MEKEGLTSLVVSAFLYYFRLLLQGHTGLLSRADMDPVTPEEIAHAEKLPGTEKAGKKALAQPWACQKPNRCWRLKTA